MLTRTITRQTFHSFTIFCVVTDIDECTANAHDCHLDATCSNTDGSFTCSCNQGYSGDGKQCDGMFGVSGEGGGGRGVVAAKRIRVFLRFSQNNFLQLYLFYSSGTLIAHYHRGQ